MGDRIKVTITGNDMHGFRYQEIHILDDYRKILFPIHKRLDMESVQVEKILDSEPEDP